MRVWRWIRAIWHHNGDLAEATRHAQEQTDRAQEQTQAVDQAIRQARNVINGADVFMEHVARSWRPRGSR